jgi:hypothetical protein
MKSLAGAASKQQLPPQGFWRISSANIQSMCGWLIVCDDMEYLLFSPQIQVQNGKGLYEKVSNDASIGSPPHAHRLPALP